MSSDVHGKYFNKHMLESSKIIIKLYCRVCCDVDVWLHNTSCYRWDDDSLLFLPTSQLTAKWVGLTSLLVDKSKEVPVLENTE